MIIDPNAKSGGSFFWIRDFLKTYGVFDTNKRYKRIKDGGKYWNSTIQIVCLYIFFCKGIKAFYVCF